MSTRTILALSAVALLVVSGAAAAAVTGSPELSVRFTDDTVLPGERTTLDLVILNEGAVDNGSARSPALNNEVTTARGVTARVRSGDAPFTVRTPEQAVGTVPQAASQPIPFTVVVDDDADAGTYSVPVTVSYTYTSSISERDGSRETETVTRTFRVPVTVEESARVDVVSVESEVSVGSTDTVSVTVENDGTVTARNAQITLTSASPALTFGQTNSATKYVGEWEPGDRTTVEYRVSASERATGGTYPFTITATYEKRGGRDMETSPVRVGVDVGPEQTFAVANVSSTLRVGDDGTLRGVVTNTGERAVDDLVLAWASEQRNVNPTETEYAVGRLAAGESREFAFDVEVSDAARAGPRQFSLVARFDADDGTRLTSESLDVRQHVAPARDEFDLAVRNATVAAGGTSIVEVRITNAGNETVSDVEAKLFADDPITSGDDEAFVPRLDPGESTTMTFSVSAGSGALEKTYPLSMDFRYDEPDGDTVTSDTYRVPIAVDAGGGGVPLALIGGGALLALVGIGAFLRFR